ncbi:MULTISPECIES: hypothetical protein [unclassified Streptomyces]|uniref:hypothetical protein n=1 Tax=unclassified Streptomyces TaxID=2593676 RepID=UPI001AF3A58F|nr:MULTISPECIES: hypothetical protein [unclassified Streptomyces]CAD5921020.1 conserved protein of unknown function [Streptomyces sp. KY75]CAD5991174.1 conserved protein of unknown function [Streptomyces sp. KY70]
MPQGISTPAYIYDLAHVVDGFTALFSNGSQDPFAGSVCNTLAGLYPKAEILLIGLSEPEAQIHAVNESVRR